MSTFTHNRLIGIECFILVYLLKRVTHFFSKLVFLRYSLGNVDLANGLPQSQANGMIN